MNLINTVFLLISTDFKWILEEIPRIADLSKLNLHLKIKSFLKTWRLINWYNLTKSTIKMPSIPYKCVWESLLVLLCFSCAHVCFVCLVGPILAKLHYYAMKHQMHFHWFLFYCYNYMLSFDQSCILFGLWGESLLFFFLAEVGIKSLLLQSTKCIFNSFYFIAIYVFISSIPYSFWVIPSKSTRK